VVALELSAMRGSGSILGAGLLLVGCATPPHATVLVAPCVEDEFARRPIANLALGPRGGLPVEAEWFAQRSDWPSVPSGYVFDQVESFTQFLFDDQSFFDRLGGSFFAQSESVRTGVVVR